MTPEPIAIVGMACRLPGGVSNPDEFWKLLVNGQSGHADFPPDRLNIDAWHHVDAAHPGSFVTRGGYFLRQDLDEFDNEFFGISAVEASTMDPAQKQLLEVAYEACEASGVTQEQLSGSMTGVYVGNFCPEQSLVGLKDVELFTPYTATGASTAMLSNRINYAMDLRGPSLTVDTACASSAYALHMACAGLRAGDCDAALVCAANTIRSVEAQMFMSKLGALSPTSTCHTFDARADGYARADGIVAIYVMRLSDAVKSGRPIRAVIRGTAIGANGSGESLTKPNGTAQEAVIRAAYKNAGIDDLENTGYFECHGTGTPIGDRVETRAVADVFSVHRAADNPLLIGSVKTNVGHSEGAAALTALIKAVLAIEAKLIPPTIGIETLNPNIDFDGWKINVVRHLTPWPEKVPVRRASINSFGFGGSNAHVVIEEAGAAVEEFVRLQAKAAGTFTSPSPQGIHGMSSSSQSTVIFPTRVAQSGTSSSHESSSSINSEPVLVVCSAKNEGSLDRTIEAVRSGLGTYTARDIATTLGHRSQLDHRAYAICDGIHEPLFQRDVRYKGLQLGFVFTGAGAQWPNMGQQLLQFPAFRQSIRRIDQYVATLPDPPDWAVEEMMQTNVSSRIMDEPRFAQLMTVSLELGLVDLLADWGIRPSMVAGHSTGEIAAAYASGYLTRDEAAAAAYYRGKVTSEAVMMPGAMLAVGLPVTQSREIIPNGTQVVVAAVNSPASVTLSGGREAIEAIKIWCDKEQIFNRLIASNGVAYHSALMEPAAEAYGDPLKALPRSSTKPNIKARWYSTVTGELYTKETVPMMYWCQNMKSPVLFMPAVAAMRDAGVTHLIEIGPHSTLRSPIMDIIKATPSDKPFSYYAAVRRKADAVLGIMNMCGELALAGVEVDVARVNGSPGVHLSGFPTYAWSHQAIVQESRVNREWRLKKHPRHELLGSLIPGSATNTKIWRNILSSSRIAWLSDYKFGNDCILPTSGFVCMANEAMRQTCEPSEDTFTIIQDLAIREALLVNSDVETFLTMTQLPLGSNITSTMVWDFNICSVRDDVSTQHCQGRIYISAQAFTASKSQSDSGDGLLEPLSVPATRWYTDLASKRGITLGERFRRMDDMFFEKQFNYAVASVDLDSPSRHLTPSARADSVLDPTVLESCFSLPLLAAGPSHANHPYLPVSIDRLTISNKISKGCKVRIDANANYLGLRSLEASCSMKMAEKITVGIQGLRFSRLPRPDNPQTQQMRLPFWQLTWVDDYHGITAETQDLYFPPGKYWPELYNKYSRYRRTYLAHMWVVQFAQRHPDLLLKEPVSDQHKHFIEWINWLLDVTRRDHPEILNMSLEERDSAIESERCVSDPGIKLSWTIYDHLAEFIEGTRSALDVITQTGLLDNFYDTQLVFNKFERVVEIMGLKNPSMRILEIGAGTGTATKHVLKSLTKGPTQLYSSYTFTDISPSFFETAAATFAEYPDMEYRVYDMENPPKEQGIEPASYDVVVASCVVHTTPNIVRALQSIRKLLRPGGMLLFSEITAEHHDLNFSLGLLPGFYSGYDEGRQRHPFLTPAQWAEALLQAGFTTPEVSVNDVPEDWHAFTVLAATAVEPNSQQVCAEDQHITIVSFDKPTDLAKCIEDGAQRQGAFVAHRSLNLSEGHYETRAGQKAGRLIVLVDLEQVVDAGAEDVDLILREMAVPMLEEATSLLWVTQKSLMGGDQPARSYLHERMVQYGTDAGLKVASMDFEAAAERGEAMAKEILRRESLLLRLEDTEFRQLQGRWLVPRLLPDRQLTQDLARSQGLDRTTSSTLLGQSGRLQLSAKSDGSLDTLAFEKNMNVDGAIPSGYLEIQVKAIGVNMMNLLGLTGSQGADCLISEFAGVVVATADDVVEFLVGDAVFGLWSGRFDNLARVPQSVCQRMRPGDSFEAAATLPLAYGTAWQAVVEAGRARSGDRVLIQSAAGGVGMAAVNLARSIGAEVYATAGSVAKRAALRDLGIPEHRIFSSRDAAEEPAMRRATGGRGFDVVLNTSSGDYLHAVSWPLVAPFGRFVELRKSTTLAAEAGIWNLGKMSEGISIIPVDMTYLCEQRRSAIADVMQAIGARYRSGVFAPLPYRSFPISQLRKVYSEFSRFEHTGKLVLTCDDDDAVPCLPMPEAARFHHDGSYLLIGAMGELMVHLTMWMVQSGVRHLIFLHAGPPPSARAGFFDNLVAAGVTVAHVESSTINRNDVQQAVASASTLPLRGIVNVLHESPREGAQGQQATVPGHVLSMMISGYHDLDFSILLGAAADAMYGGLPWTKIHLTPAQTTHEMLELICVALSDVSRRAAKRVQEPIYIVPHTDAGSVNNPCSNAQHQGARWAVVKSHNSTQSRRAARASSNGYSAATSAGIVGAIDDIRNQVVDRLSKLLWVPQERLRAEMSLHGVGIDSMIASEFRSWIQQTFRTSISMMELLSQNMTIEKLAKVLGGEN